MDNVRPEDTEDQYVTSPKGENLGRNIHVRRSEPIRNSPQRYNPGSGASIECNNDNVSSIVCMIQDRDLNSNVDMNDIILLLDEWYAENCMDTPSTFRLRDSYVLNYQSHDPDTPTYMEALSDEDS